MARSPKAPISSKKELKGSIETAPVGSGIAPTATPPVAAGGSLDKVPARRGRPPKAKIGVPATAPDPAPAEVSLAKLAAYAPAASAPMPPVIAAPAAVPKKPAEVAVKPPVIAPTIPAVAVPAPVPAPEPAPALEPQPMSLTTPSQPDVVEPQPAAMPFQIPEGKLVMSDAIETTKMFAEDAQSRFQSMFSEINDKTKSAMEKSAKAFEEMGDLAKGNLEAFVESSKIAAKGFETISQTAAELGRQSFEKTSSTMKSFASVKSPAEFFQLHSELMTQTIDTMAAEAAKTSETLLKLAGDVAQPISSRVAIVTDKMKTIAN